MTRTWAGACGWSRTSRPIRSTVAISSFFTALEACSRARSMHPHLLLLFVPEGGHEIGPLLIEHPQLGGEAGLGAHPAAERARDADVEEIEHVHQAQGLGQVRRLAQTGFELAQAVRQFRSEAVRRREFQLHRAHAAQPLLDEVVGGDHVARLPEVAGEIGFRTDAEDPGDGQHEQDDHHDGHLPRPRQAPVHRRLQQALDAPLPRRRARIARPPAEE